MSMPLEIAEPETVSPGTNSITQTSVFESSLIEISDLGNLLFRGGDGLMERVSTSFQQMPLQLKHMFVLYAVRLEELFDIRVRLFVFV